MTALYHWLGEEAERASFYLSDRVYDGVRPLDYPNAEQMREQRLRAREAIRVMHEERIRLGLE